VLEAGYGEVRVFLKNLKSVTKTEQARNFPLKTQKMLVRKRAKISPQSQFPEFCIHFAIATGRRRFNDAD
jgi:hypothetical protein